MSEAIVRSRSLGSASFISTGGRFPALDDLYGYFGTLQLPLVFLVDSTLFTAKQKNGNQLYPPSTVLQTVLQAE